MKKRILGLILFLLLFLAACGGKAQQTDPTPAPAQQPTSFSATPSTYDPGPYFTPRRPAPEDPATFQPAAAYGDFAQKDSSGNCLQQRGLNSQYQNEAGETIYFACRFMTRQLEAQQAVASVVEANTLSGDPLAYEIQGDESFVLGASGNGFVYAWTHGQWFFLVRSNQGRPPLDAFMQSLPF